MSCLVGVTDDFKVEVGLHQGSDLSPFVFLVMMLGMNLCVDYDDYVQV